MNFSSNIEMVEEVKEFIKNKQLFNNPSYINGKDIIVVEGFSQAQEFAWSQELSDEYTNWEYVKSYESESITNKIYNQGLEKEQEELYEYFSSYENYSEEFNPFDYADINEEVEGDLAVCALNRLVNGVTDNFYEKLFQIYKNGGWPCGWKGSHPEGRMLVFIPKSIETGEK